MKKLLLALNLVLLTGVVIVCVRLGRADSSVSMPPKLENLPTPADARPPTPIDFRLGWRPLGRESGNVIVAENLFDESREYHLPPEATEENAEGVAEEEEDKLEFELLGLVQIGSRACATLLMKGGESETPPPALGRRPPSPRSMPPAGKAGGKRGVVLLGEEIFGSGWFLTSVSRDELGNPVAELTNPAHPTWKPRRATLDRGDEASRARLSTAREVEEKKLAVERAAVSPPETKEAAPEPPKAGSEEPPTPAAGAHRKTPAEAMRELIEQRQKRRMGHGLAPGAAPAEGTPGGTPAPDPTVPATGGTTPGTNREPVKTPLPPGLP